MGAPETHAEGELCAVDELGWFGRQNQINWEREGWPLLTWVDLFIKWGVLLRLGRWEGDWSRLPMENLSRAQLLVHSIKMRPLCQFEAARLGMKVINKSGGAVWWLRRGVPS